MGIFERLKMVLKTDEERAVAQEELDRDPEGFKARGRARLSELLERQKAGALSAEEEAELGKLQTSKKFGYLEPGQ
mgnify:CR=1 FL=1